MAHLPVLYGASAWDARPFLRECPYVCPTRRPWDPQSEINPWKWHSRRTHCLTSTAVTTQLSRVYAWLSTHQEAKVPMIRKMSRVPKCVQMSRFRLPIARLPRVRSIRTGRRLNDDL